jgi:hypothetical protein
MMSPFWSLGKMELFPATALLPDPDQRMFGLSAYGTPTTSSNRNTQLCRTHRKARKFPGHGLLSVKPSGLTN